MDVSSPNNKKIQERTFRSLKKCPIFPEIKLSSRKLKILLHFFLKKIYQISGRNLQSLKNKDYLYFLLTGRNMDGSKATSQIGDNSFKSMKKKKQA